MRAVFGDIRRLGTLAEEELYTEAKELQAPFELVRWVAERPAARRYLHGGRHRHSRGRALCMQLGADGVFVGSGIFKSADPLARAKAIVEATTHYSDPEILARVSTGLGEPMRASTRPRSRPRNCPRLWPVAPKIGAFRHTRVRISRVRSKAGGERPKARGTVSRGDD